MSIYIWDKEIKNLYAWWSISVSDMQGPAPKWFHVPLSSEWENINNAGISLWAWKWYTPVDFSTYLKIPMAGYREFNNTVYEIGSEGQYWSSSAHASDASYAYFLMFRGSDVNPTAYANRARGIFVRCVKNSPTIPTASWTVLYQWTWDAWIFHNPTDWLISISSDGSTWYTLMDKNLGATTVYNYWDALSVANTGNIFQWWNNYPFPSTLSSDSITTSSTQVNATGYWPWNYYSSSTYITWNGNWSYVNNKDLRWWVSQWTTEKSKAAKEIYLWDVKVWPNIIINFATQWPAPDGFHVPLNSEWEWVKTIMDWLSLTAWDNWRINLHMPFTGFREYSNAGLSYQGIGYYWSSSPSESNRPYYARYLYLESYNIYTFNDNQRARGQSIRCFKNSYMKPTSSWTVINGTLWSAWIFWNQNKWLISITSNWTTWYTIQDKNLWATAVYSDWDTLTQANMWNMYQWWNNYWFPSTWSVSKTSSTQVNAQNYWPWNYYESDTFITRSGRPYDWSSVRNDNLRWWVDWNVPV